ncbi:hypothetical protein EDB81DRAFT_196618 [Dactylonectria macrodidyma]|uniref:Uncharacterized protein n=1 Tax=Dactylonectria macrodidyma TaxID=307937 RepID=A0A9P9JHJ4_9HYPO|nr:hypothetical protein EDB81DRAFT_196618 [Dactylonectria macrodidyma]
MVWFMSDSLTRNCQPCLVAKLVITLMLDLGRASRWQWVGVRDTQPANPQAAPTGWLDIKKLSTDLAYAGLQQSAILPACTGQNSLTKNSQTPLATPHALFSRSSWPPLFALPTMHTDYTTGLVLHPSTHTPARIITNEGAERQPAASCARAWLGACAARTREYDSPKRVGVAIRLHSASRELQQLHRTLASLRRLLSPLSAPLSEPGYPMTSPCPP